MKKRKISDAVIRRLPRYYRYLDDLHSKGIVRISSSSLGERMDITASQIRQDLSCFGEFGQQGYGYNILELRTEIGHILGVKPDCTRTKCGNDWLMPRLHAVFTVERRHDQTVCRTGIKLTIRRDDLQIEGVFHQSAPISCAFLRTSSTVPTMEKAASGY